MANIKATIFFDKRYWVGTFERTDKEGYAVAKHIFGAEPADPEVYEFVLNHYQELKFGEPKEFTLEIKWKANRDQSPQRIEPRARSISLHLRFMISPLLMPVERASITIG
jgi:hypothetical protein